MVLIVDELAGSGLHLPQGYSIDACEDLCIAHVPTVCEHLLSDFVGCTGGGVLLQEDLGLQVRLRSLDLVR